MFKLDRDANKSKEHFFFQWRRQSFEITEAFITEGTDIIYSELKNLRIIYISSPNCKRNLEHKRLPPVPLQRRAGYGACPVRSMYTSLGLLSLTSLSCEAPLCTTTNWSKRCRHWLVGQGSSFDALVNPGSQVGLDFIDNVIGNDFFAQKKRALRP